MNTDTGTTFLYGDSFRLGLRSYFMFYDMSQSATVPYNSTPGSISSMNRRACGLKNFPLRMTTP